MSTVMNNGTGPILPPPANEPRDESQIRRERWTAALGFAVVVALVALMIWLASISGVEYDGSDYWQMLP